MKYHDIEFDDHRYYSYWVQCIDKCLKSSDLTFYNRIGYYSVFKSEEAQGEIDNLRGVPSMTEFENKNTKKKKSGNALSKLTNTINLDIYCESRDLDRPYPAIASLVLKNEYKYLDNDLEIFLLYREYSMTAKRLALAVESMEFNKTSNSILEEILKYNEETQCWSQDEDE